MKYFRSIYRPVYWFWFLLLLPRAWYLIRSVQAVSHPAAYAFFTLITAFLSDGAVIGALIFLVHLIQPSLFSVRRSAFQVFYFFLVFFFGVVLSLSMIDVEFLR